MLLGTGDAGVISNVSYGDVPPGHLTGMAKSKDSGQGHRPGILSWCRRCQNIFNLAENPSWLGDSFFVSRAGTRVGVTQINCMGHARRCNKQVVDTREPRPSTATTAWCL